MHDPFIPALGRIAEIGTLYDADTDRFLQASVLPGDRCASHVSIQPDSRTEIALSSCASYADVFKDLHIGDTTAVHILADLVHLRGSAVFLRDFSPGGGIGAAVIHQILTVNQTLDNLIEAFNSGSDLTPLRTSHSHCTHVVTGIRWGLRTVIAANRPTSNKSSRLEEDEKAAFVRDLNSLRCAIESAHLTAQRPPEMELCNELTLYSDVLDEEGLVMQDISEVCDFIRIAPDHVRRESGGKGWPIAYTMIPMTALCYFLTLPREFQIGLKPTRNDYLANFIQLFDDFEAAAVKLQSYHVYLKSHMAHVAKDHMNLVLASIESLGEMKRGTLKQLHHALLDVRNGKRELSILHDVYRRAVSEEPTPKQLSAIAGQETDKLEFIAGVIAQGAKYLGHNGLSLGAVSKSRKGSRYYVFHFDSASMNQTGEWNDNCVLLLELLGQSDEDMPVYILDHDAANSHIHPEVPYISQYKGEEELIPDVLRHRQFLSSKCFARSCDAALDTSKHQRPVKRSIVRMPCPRPGCESKQAEWLCPHCMTEIEYGSSDGLFYCECGCGPFGTFEFKCNDPEHGSGYEKYDSETLRSILSGMGQDDDYINILILGETGVGKSTFINAFVNYLSYSTLDEAKDADGLASVIPCSFSLQSMDRENLERGIQEYNIKVGAREDEADGSTGKSATQKSSVYAVTIGTKTYRLIDTPGIGDTRGLSYDKENMADILKTISSYDALHGILVLVKSNNARLTVTFRFCVKELLTHLHRSAAKSMAFGFTNTRISNYAPGDTFKPLKSLLDEHTDIPITLSASTTYCFDSESFRYLAAYKQGVPQSNEQEFRLSWDHSRKEAHRLLSYFASTPPHPVSSTLSLNGARRLILELTKPMASISESIRKSIKLCESKKAELGNTRLAAHGLRRRLRLERIQFTAVKLEKPRTVCKNISCCDFKDSGLGDGEVVTIYKTHCHPICYLINVKEDVVADPGLMQCWAFYGTNTCRVCQHRWQEHLHVLYELSESKVEVTDTEIERQLKANADDMTLRQTALNRLNQTIEEYKHELDEIRRAAARFCLFLRENAITVINDATLDYIDMLIQDEKSLIDAGKQRGIPIDANQGRLEALQGDRQIHIQLVETFRQNMKEPTCSDDALLDERGVDALVQKLYKLKHFGGDLEHIKYVIASSLEETSRERPFRVRAWSNRGARSGHYRRREPSRSRSPPSYTLDNRHRQGRGERRGESREAVPRTPEESTRFGPSNVQAPKSLFNRFFPWKISST